MVSNHLLIKCNFITAALFAGVKVHLRMGDKVYTLVNLAAQ